MNNIFKSPYCMIVNCIILCFPNFTVTAAAQTSHEAALTKMASKLVYSERRCKELRANLPALLVIGSSYGVTISDWQPGGRLRNLLEADLVVMQKENDQSSTNIYCAAAMYVFGPNGTVAPNALIEK